MLSRMLQTVVGWFEADRASSRTDTHESRELDLYLSQAQSLAELEHLQKQWDRGARSSGVFAPIHGGR